MKAKVKRTDYRVNNVETRTRLKSGSIVRKSMYQLRFKRWSVRAHYFDLGSAHQGNDGTIKRLRERYYWVTMKKDVEDVVLECKSCLKNKATQYRVALRSLPVPQRKFD